MWEHTHSIKLANLNCVWVVLSIFILYKHQQPPSRELFRLPRLPPPQPPAPAALSVSVWLLRVPHVSAVMAFGVCVWLAHLPQHSVLEVRPVLAGVRVSSLGKADYSSILWMDHVLCIPPSTDGHVGWVHVELSWVILLWTHVYNYPFETPLSTLGHVCSSGVAGPHSGFTIN